MDRDRLIAELKILSPQGKISCNTAFELAEKYKLSRSEMGELLNQQKIKIVNCQLGCF
jgi:hypothetical protein